MSHTKTDTAAKHGVTILSPWEYDPHAYDPSVRRRFIEFADRRFVLYDHLGPGFPTVIRPVDNPHLVSDTADWDDWASVARAARRIVAFESERAYRLAMRRPCEGCGAAPYEACGPFCLSHEED